MTAARGFSLGGPISANAPQRSPFLPDSAAGGDLTLVERSRGMSDQAVREICEAVVCVAMLGFFAYILRRFC